MMINKELVQKATSYEEYDPPLPKRIANPTKEDKEKLQRLTEKYKKLAAERKSNS